MNSNQLKLFAIITMVIDHIGYALFPEVLLLRIIGRLSLPIFAFLVAEGYHYTRNIKQYMFRIFIFAIIKLKSSRTGISIKAHGTIFSSMKKSITNYP